MGLSFLEFTPFFQNLGTRKRFFRRVAALLMVLFSQMLKLEHWDFKEQRSLCLKINLSSKPHGLGMRTLDQYWYTCKFKLVTMKSAWLRKLCP